MCFYIYGCTYTHTHVHTQIHRCVSQDSSEEQNQWCYISTYGTYTPSPYTAYCVPYMYTIYYSILYYGICILYILYMCICMCVYIYIYRQRFIIKNWLLWLWMLRSPMQTGETAGCVVSVHVWRLENQEHQWCKSQSQAGEDRCPSSTDWVWILPSFCSI